MAANNSPQQEVRTYWLDNYSAIKDDWNSRLIDYHSKARVLLKQEVSDLVLYGDENATVLFDRVKENLDQNYYEQHLPKSIHGAFVDAHATAYHLVFKCGDNIECENRKELINLANTQLARVELLQSCLSYHIAGKLLLDPYNIEHRFELPDRCKEI